MISYCDPGRSGDVSNGFAQLARLIVPLLILSLVSNLAVLISPLFMMQVIDRVIPSGNVATLLLLGLLAIGALILQAVVEFARDLTLGRVARWVEARGAGMAISPECRNGQPLIEDAARLGRFVSGGALIAALNLPWIPVFLLALALIHPQFLLLLALLCGLLLISRTLCDMTIGPSDAAVEEAARQENGTLAEIGGISRKSGMALMRQNLLQRFAALQAGRHGRLDQAEPVRCARSGIATFLRSASQITALGLGAYLVTRNSLSPGGMIAASILLSKSYAIAEATLGQLPAIRAGLASYASLCAAPDTGEMRAAIVPEFQGGLRADGVIVPRGAGLPPRLDRVSFELEPGEVMVIIGNSGAGKSTLLKALAGAEPAPIGSVFLDDSEIRGLNAMALGQSVGFLPQRAEMAAASIADNIAHLDPQADRARIVAAARMAGVHGLISALPDAYATDLGAHPYLLSAGQAQRVALARALYVEPRYLFLDEPNALLDADGERALGQTLQRLRAQGTTIVMVLQRSGLMGMADKILRLERGRVIDMGNRSEVLGRLGIGGRKIDLPLLESSLEDLRDWIAAQFTRTTDQEFSQKAQIVGSEMFQIARMNGPQDLDRQARFEFTFVDDGLCELSLTEPVASALEDKKIRVAALVDKRADFAGLTDDERAIASVIGLSDRFDIVSNDASTRLSVSLTDKAAEGSGGRLI